MCLGMIFCEIKQLGRLRERNYCLSEIIKELGRLREWITV